MKTVSVEGQAYDVSSVTAFKSFDEFKTDALEQVKATKSERLHFAAWGDQQGAKLKEVWDSAQSAKAKAAEQTATAKQPAPKAAPQPAAQAQPTATVQPVQPATQPTTATGDKK